MATPFLYRMWVMASALALPFAMSKERAKLRDAGFDKIRIREKLGHPSVARGDGPVVWFHAASVGESMAVLALITRMGVHLPDAQFVITTGTATSAGLLAKRLPPRTVHQFAPLDAPGPLRRFLKHWRPQAALFVESEMWPQMLRRTHASGTHMALINARLSQRSLERWAKRPKLAAFLFGVFDLILTQNRAMAKALSDLPIDPERISAGVNLKSMSAALPVDPMGLAKTKAALGTRPVWVASSTHPGEEEIVLAAHNALLAQHPDLCLILAPRHPERGTEVRDLIAATGLSYTRRTRGEEPTAAVYLADTLGELGQWYSLADIVFLGGSMLPIGGHNPFEVAQAGAFTLSGNHVANFAETFAAMEATGAARLVADADDLARQVGALLQDTSLRTKGCAAASAFCTQRGDLLDDIAQRLIATLRIAP